MAVFSLAARIMLAAVFAFAGFAKLADRTGFHSALRDFRLIGRTASVAAVTVPLVEVSLAIGLLVPATAWWSAVLAEVLLATFVAMIMSALRRGIAPACHCFGRLDSGRLGRRSVLRNAVLAALGWLVLVKGPGASQLGPLGWIGSVTHGNAVLFAIELALAVPAMALAFYFLRLLRKRVARGRPGEPQTGLTGLKAVLALASARSAKNELSMRLPVDTAAPDFELPTTGGTRLSLDDLLARGLAILLVFIDPGCGPCTELLPDLGTWQRRYGKRLTVAVASRGTIDATIVKVQPHRLSNVMIEADGHVFEAYRAYGTPAAVLISSSGRIATPVAAGVEAISRLIEERTGTYVTLGAAASEDKAMAVGQHPVRDELSGSDRGAVSSKYGLVGWLGPAVSRRRMLRVTVGLTAWMGLASCSANQEVAQSLRRFVADTCATKYCFKPKSQSMTLSKEGANFIKEQEKYCPELYNDGAGCCATIKDPKKREKCTRIKKGNCTIGWGHKVHRGVCNGVPSEKPFLNGFKNPTEAEKLFDQDVVERGAKYVNQIKAELDQDQFDALVDFTFNAGSPKLAPIKRVLNCGDYDAVPDLIIQQGKGQPKKIQDRRAAEAAMFRKGRHNKQCGSGQKCCSGECCNGECLGSGPGGAQLDQQGMCSPSPSPSPTKPSPSKVYCSCNGTCYDDVGTCNANCHVTPGCFSAICGPAQPGQC